MPRLLIALAVAAALSGMYAIGRTDGRKLAEHAAQEKWIVSMTRAIDQAAQLAAQDAEVLSADVVRAEHIRVVYRDIKQELIRYVATYPNAGRPDQVAKPVRTDAERADCALDADGLRLWRAANAGAYSALTGAGAPGAALSGTAATTQRMVAGPADQPYRGGGAVSAVPRTTSEPE